MAPKRGRKNYCEKHYMRVYRNGTTESVAPKPARRDHSHGYILVPSNRHPLAQRDTYIYEHRKVYYDAHGAGPFSCHWCSVVVTWQTLHVDHVDDDKKNNALSNLVASCAHCNKERGRHKAAGSWRARTGVEALGQVRTISEWSRITGLARSALLRRLKKGWSPDRTMSEPRGKFGPKSRKDMPKEPQ